MKYLILVLAVFFAAPAQAGDVVCIGRDINLLAPAMKAAGFRLVEWKDSTCGGKVGEDGVLTEKWRCFIQKWKIADEGFAYLFYAKHNGGWVLSNGRSADGGVMDLEPCK